MYHKISHTGSFSKNQMKYKQTDITSFFGNSKMKKIRANKHKKFKSTSITTEITTVVLVDSDDSDFEPHENVALKNKKKKPKLPFPMSDNEDSMDETESLSQSNNVETMIQLDKSQKSYNEEIFPGGASTSKKTISSNNSSTISDNTIILNESASSDVGHPDIQSRIISHRDDNNETLNVTQNNKVRTMMQLNRPQKPYSEKIFPEATSTPLKTKMQKESDQTVQNISNNSITNSDDTIILNKSTSSDGDHPKIIQNIVIAPRDKNKENRKTSESTEDISESPCKKLKKHDTTECEIGQSTFVQQNLKVTVVVGKTNIETNINVPHKLNESSNSSSSAHKSGITSKINNIKPSTSLEVSSPSTSGQTNFINVKPLSSLQSKKNLFGSSTMPQILTNKIKLGSPKKNLMKSRKNDSHITPKRKFGAAGFSSKQNSTSPKSNSSPLKPEEKNDKLNFGQLNCMKELFKNSLEDDGKRQLLLANDVEIIEEFLDMHVHYQFLLMKLFLYLPNWYNITKFCTKIKLDQKMTPRKVTEMYKHLKERKYVHTDITSLDVDVLLNMLLLIDLKRISAKFRVGKCNNKKDLIQILKKNCRTQSTLSSKKSTEDLLKEAAHECLGFCVKLRDDIRRSFYKAYLLQTFTNSLYIDPQKYLSDISFLNITYPEYTVEVYTPFSNRDQYSSFYEALLLKKEYIDASDKNNHFSMKSSCDTAFERLQNITPEGKWLKHLSEYLQRFSAEYQYISILKTAAKKLMKYPESVKTWLEFLIENYPSHYAIGFWYKQLAHVLIKYEKDYESAAQIVIQGFESNKEKHIFNLVELYDLNLLATKIRTTKSYKVCALFCDKLAELAELPIKSDHFPTKTILGHTDRNGKSGRRTYSFIDENDEENFGNVEMIVLNDYQKEDNYEGVHCEGRLLSILFTLFFWDIIYCYYVPNTFISKFQHAPLDMYTDCFYKNRTFEIDQRLEDIALNWSSEEITKFLKENWDYHSHEETIAKFNTVTTDVQELLRMFKCIDRKVLSKMFKRLVTSFKTFHSGLPDLFLWNSNLSQCKFVEVKGEGDKLSHKQILWIQYLIDIGADVEVCHVSGVGSRKMQKSNDQR